MRDERAFLFDMLESARLAQRYISGKSFDDFMNDGMMRDAILWRLSVIGEAAKKVSQPTRQLLPTLPFDDMAAMRNLLIHTYWLAKWQTVWDTVAKDLPVLIDAIGPLLTPPDPSAGL